MVLADCLHCNCALTEELGEQFPSALAFLGGAGMRPARIMNDFQRVLQAVRETARQGQSFDKCRLSGLKRLFTRLWPGRGCKGPAVALEEASH